MQLPKISILLMLLGFGICANGQMVTETLELEWEASVHYGTNNQRTVALNDTLWHLGGRFFYGAPFDIPYYAHSYVEYMAIAENAWRVDTTKTIYRSSGNAEVFNNSIYIFGGSGSQPEAVEVFHPASRTITRAADLPNPRWAGGSVIYEGKLYLVGGSNSVGYSDLVDIFDIASDTWSLGAVMPMARQTETILKNGKIYSFGGYDGSVRDEIYEYDISSNTWSETGNMPEGTSAHKLAVYGDYVYVVGDYVDMNRIQRYAFSDASWIDYESNFIGRRHASLALTDNKLYIVAGNASRSNGSYQYFRIVQSIDLSGLVSTTSERNELPKTLELVQNSPNPFNPSTSIQFKLNESSQIKVTIYDIQGRAVKQLVDEQINAGEQSYLWDGTDEAGQQLPSGQYLYALHVGKEVLARKMILLR